MKSYIPTLWQNTTVGGNNETPTTTRKTIIAGGRDFDNQEFLDKICDIFKDQISEVVSGFQRVYDIENRRYYGADFQGE